MKKIHTFLVLFIAGVFATTTVNAQSSTQTIKGTVTDKLSQATIPGVNIIIMGSEPLKGTTSDLDGHFKISDVTPGRYDLKITYVGYREIVIPNVVVTSGKEVVLEVAKQI